MASSAALTLRERDGARRPHAEAQHCVEEAVRVQCVVFQDGCCVMGFRDDHVGMHDRRGLKGVGDRLPSATRRECRKLQSFTAARNVGKAFVVFEKTFHNMPRATCRELSAVATFRQLVIQEELITAGDHVSLVFFIFRGECVTKPGPGGAAFLAEEEQRYGPGHVVGWQCAVPEEDAEIPDSLRRSSAISAALGQSGSHRSSSGRECFREQEWSVSVLAATPVELLVVPKAALLDDLSPTALQGLRRYIATTQGAAQAEDDRPPTSLEPSPQLTKATGTGRSEGVPSARRDSAGTGLPDVDSLCASDRRGARRRLSGDEFRPNTTTGTPGRFAEALGPFSSGRPGTTPPDPRRQAQVDTQDGRYSGRDAGRLSQRWLSRWGWTSRGHAGDRSSFSLPRDRTKVLGLRASPASPDRSATWRIKKVRPSWSAVTIGGAGTKLLQMAERHKPFGGRVLSTMGSEDDSSSVVTAEGDSHYGGFRIGSEAELGSGIGSPGMARAKYDCGGNPGGGVFVGSGPRKAGETVSVGAEGRPEQRAYALVQLSTRSGLDGSDPRAALCMRLLGSFETEAQATRRLYNIFHSVLPGKESVCWRPLHRREDQDDSSIPGRSTEDVVFLLRKGVPVQCTSFAVVEDGRRRCGPGDRRLGSGGNRVRDGDDDFGRGYDFVFPPVFKRKGERFALAFVRSAERLKDFRNEDRGWDENQLQQQQQTGRRAEERAAQDAPSASSSNEEANGSMTVLTEVHANGQDSLRSDRTSSAPPCGGCASRPKHGMDAWGCSASDPAAREGLALAECQTAGIRETENPDGLDAFKTSSAAGDLVTASSEHLSRAEEMSSSRRISGLTPAETLGDEALHVAAHRSMKREHWSTVDSSEGSSEGKNAIQDGHHPLEANGLDCGSYEARVAHLREPCSEVLPSRRSGSSEETEEACFPGQETGEYSPMSPPDNAYKTAPCGVEKSGMTCHWWKTDGLCFLEKVEGYYETEDLASKRAKHRRGRFDGEARSGCSSPPRRSSRTITRGFQIGDRRHATVLPVYRWFSLGDGTIPASHRAILGYSLSDREATTASSLAIAKTSSAEESMNKRIRATMRLRMENTPRTAGSGRDLGQRGAEHFFGFLSQGLKAPSPLGDAAEVVCGPMEDGFLGESDRLLRLQEAGSSSVCGDADHQREGVGRDEMRKAAWGAIRRARSAVLSKNQKLIETEVKVRRRVTTSPFSSAADHDDSSRSSASCWSPRGRAILTGQGQDDHETLLLSKFAVASTTPTPLRALNQEYCASAHVDSMAGSNGRPWAVIASGPGEAGESRERLRAQMHIERKRARLFEEIRRLPYKTAPSMAASKGGGKVARSTAKAKRVADNIGNGTDEPTRILGLHRAAEVRAQARLHGKPPTPFVRPRSVKAPAGRVCSPPLSPSPSSPKSASSIKAEEQATS